MKTSLQNGSFWKYFYANSTNGDGHCLIYSMIDSMKDQCNIDFNYSNICNRIRTETHDYISYYKDLLLIESNLEIQRLLCAYVDGKNFDTRFGDLIPLILSNVLCVSIIIISKNGGSYDYFVTYPRINCHGFVFIHKVGDHYEGLKMVVHIGSPIGIQHTTKTTPHGSTSGTGSVSLWPFF